MRTNRWGSPYVGVLTTLTFWPTRLDLCVNFGVQRLQELCVGRHTRLYNRLDHDHDHPSSLRQVLRIPWHRQE